MSSEASEVKESEVKASEVKESEVKASEVKASEVKESQIKESNRDAGGIRDTIFIGKKPLMAYVTATLIQLASIPAVSIKARGMSIGRAVDVAQIISRKTENAGYIIGTIKIGSESLESQDGRQRNVSTIDIEIKRT